MKKSLFLILLLILLNSCATNPIYEAVSLEDDIDYHLGREIAIKEGDLFNSWSVYNNSNTKEIVFFITIKNNSDNKIIVSPESFNLTFEHSDNNLYSALNPETYIDKLIKSKNDVENEHGFLTGLNMLFGVANVAASISEEKYEKIPHDILVTADVQSHTNDDYSNEMNHLDNQMHYWENEVLRKTTLYPNEEISGFVNFKYKRNEEKFELHIPIGKELHAHRFLLKQLN